MAENNQKEYSVTIKSKEPDFYQGDDKKIKGHTYTTVKKVKAGSEDEAKNIAKKEFKSSKTYQNQKDNIPSSFENRTVRVSAKISGGGGSGTLRQIRSGAGGPFASGSPRKKFKQGGTVCRIKPKLAKKGYK
jgi:hypothetical protein